MIRPCHRKALGLTLGLALTATLAAAPCYLETGDALHPPGTLVLSYHTPACSGPGRYRLTLEEFATLRSAGIDSTGRSFVTTAGAGVPRPMDEDEKAAVRAVVDAKNAPELARKNRLAIFLRDVCPGATGQTRVICDIVPESGLDPAE